MEIHKLDVWLGCRQCIGKRKHSKLGRRLNKVYAKTKVKLNRILLSFNSHTVEVRHTSVTSVILSERSAPGLTCNLLFGATRHCLEPRPVASGPEASVSPDWLFGTHCPRTFESRNSHWNVSNLC